MSVKMDMSSGRGSLGVRLKSATSLLVMASLAVGAPAWAQEQTSGPASTAAEEQQPGAEASTAEVAVEQEQEQAVGGDIVVTGFRRSLQSALNVKRRSVSSVDAIVAEDIAPAPGYIATNNTAALQADETRNRQILERIPAGRWGKPSDLDGAVTFLASAASDYVHGHVLTVDGGWMGR